MKTYIQCQIHPNYGIIDSGGCSECYAARAKAQKKADKEASKPKPEPIKQVSEKKKVREAKLAKVRQKRKKEINYCESCGKTGIPLSYSHIVKVSGYLDLEAHPDNGILECMECHTEYENGNIDVKMKQKSWPRKLAVIMELKPSYLNKLLLKQDSK